MDGYECVEKTTGISKSAQIDLLESLQRNEESLNCCQWHVFNIEIPQKLGLPLYKCQNCGGIVSFTEKYWYEKGLIHGMKG